MHMGQYTHMGQNSQKTFSFMLGREKSLVATTSLEFLCAGFPLNFLLIGDD